MITFSPKPAGAEQRYTWAPSLLDGDSISSFILTGTGVTVSASHLADDGIEMFLSGGTGGTTGTIAASAYTSFGETLTETIYVPIYGSDSAFSATAQDIIDYALRPVVGIGGTASSGETNDALEWLNDMLAAWKGQGADVGATLPLTTTSVIYAPDEWLSAIKNNLRVFVAEQYGRQASPVTVSLAMRGLQLVKNMSVPDERRQAEYF